MKPLKNSKLMKSMNMTLQFQLKYLPSVCKEFSAGVKVRKIFRNKISVKSVISFCEILQLDSRESSFK